MVDYSKFSPNVTDREVKYNLPADIKFCKKCVISNQRPNSTNETSNKENKKETINFDAEEVCDACRATERKQAIDWDMREKELRELCDKYRSKDGSYDCLVPGSGGKDSFYAAHKLKYEYGMTPLTVTWAPNLYTTWGWHNFQAWIHAGFDNYLVTPNGLVHRLLTRLAVDKLLHPFQPFIIGQKFFAPKIAAMHDIQLVFYGENEAEYGNPVKDNDSALRDYRYFTSQNDEDIYLGGVNIKSLKEDYGLNEGDLKDYLPADPQVFEDKNIQVHYLGYYLKWHPQGAYYYSVEHSDFQPAPERTQGTYSKYNSIDDKMDDFHFWTLFNKFGIGRATYDASQEIRNDEIDREEGVALVKKFDGEYPDRFEKELFEYLSIPEKQYGKISKNFESPIFDKDYFMDLAYSFRSPHLWNYENGVWSLRKTVWSENESLTASAA